MSDKSLTKFLFFQIFIESFRYLSSVFITPAVLLSAFWIIIPFIIIQDVFLGGSLRPIFEHIPFIDSILKNGAINLGNKEILKLFWYLTLIYYLINLIFRIIFKVRISMPFKKQVLFAFFTSLSLIIISYTLFLLTEGISINLHIMFLILGVLLIVLTQAAIVVNWGTNYLIKTFRNFLLN